jgi:hypothetical protein
MNLYILENKEVKQIDSNKTGEWLDWHSSHGPECLVDYTRLFGCVVRTRFEGCDTTGANRPFCIAVSGPTMYGGARAETWEEAAKFHRMICDRIEDEKMIEYRKLAHEEHNKGSRS